MSRKPGKQRKAVREAPLHMRQRFAAAHLSPALRKQIGKRSLALRKGDEVRVMRGSHRGTVGKVEMVDLKETKVYIENLKRKKVAGTEKSIPMQPSKLMITNLVMEDKERKMSVERRSARTEQKTAVKK
jgi:large subunit ribosomal protein L24